MGRRPQSCGCQHGRVQRLIVNGRHHARSPRLLFPMEGPFSFIKTSRKNAAHVRFAPYALATRPILPSALRWQNDTEYNALVRTHLSRSADVSATIRRDHVIDLVVGNRRPNTVHFNFVVIAKDATLGRPTIHQIAARTSVVSSELRVEAVMPFIVARTVVSLLRRSVHTKKQGSRAAECGQQFPSSDGDCHTPLPCEVRKGNDTTPTSALS